jgi:hypothetical protein
MKYEVETDLPVDIGAVLPYIQDLAKYPQWMGLVHAVTPLDEDGGRQVELRGKIGPFARSKRLRMVAVVEADPHRVRFERSENDGRDHARWVLQAAVADVSADSTPVTRVSITLLYEGRLWSPVVERVLADEIERSKSRLRDLVMPKGE